MMPQPPTSTLFPYTTLFRSVIGVLTKQIDERYEDKIKQTTDVAAQDRIRHDKRSDIARVSQRDRKSTRLNSSHVEISYAVFCLKKKKIPHRARAAQLHHRHC